MVLNDFDLNKRVINVPRDTSVTHNIKHIVTRMRPGAPVGQRRCSAAAVAQCAPSSQSARLQWASPSGRLRASVRTELRAADTPPQTPSDASSARPQQDARGKERACGTAEHFSGEHRPAFKWWVRASERGLFWGEWVRSHRLAARTRTLLEYCVFLCQCDHGGLVEDKHTITLYPCLSLHWWSSPPLSDCTRVHPSH